MGLFAETADELEQEIIKRNPAAAEALRARPGQAVAPFPDIAEAARATAEREALNRMPYLSRLLANAVHGMQTLNLGLRQLAGYTTPAYAPAPGEVEAHKRYGNVLSEVTPGGGVAQIAGESLPLIAVPGSLAVRSVPKLAVYGGLTGAGLGALTPVTEDEDRLMNMLESGGFGALLLGGGTRAMHALRNLVRRRKGLPPIPWGQAPTKAPAPAPVPSEPVPAAPYPTTEAPEILTNYRTWPWPRPSVPPQKLAQKAVETVKLAQVPTEAEPLAKIVTDLEARGRVLPPEVKAEIETLFKDGNAVEAYKRFSQFLERGR